jgi:hypothetical protein
MRGEFFGVWKETYREIWAPLLAEEGVPDDVYSQLYRELAASLSEPSGDGALRLVLSDSILLREAFETVPVLAEIEIERATVTGAFEASGAQDSQDLNERRMTCAVTLGALIGDLERARMLLDQAFDAIAADPRKRAEARERVLDRVLNDTNRSKDAFEAVQASEFGGERSIIAFLEGAFSVLYDLSGDSLSNRYFNLLTEFIDKFSLRYDLRRPCTLCPTLPGVFASLVRDLRVLASQDAHLDTLMKEFENAVRDLRHDCSDGRIKTCIQKQVNLLEAIGRTTPGVTEAELSGICNQVTTWPHGAIKAALKNLYGFACDYPGIRHGGNPAGALRAVDMRDMVAMSILLAGFTPYLAARLNADSVYRGA